MGGLLGSMLAGAATGGADAFVRGSEQQAQRDFSAEMERARQAHAENLQRLSQEYQSGEKQLDRQYQSGEKQLDRDYQSGEKKDDRAWRSGENDVEYNRRVKMENIQRSGKVEDQKAAFAQQEKMENLRSSRSSSSYGKLYDDLVERGYSEAEADQMARSMSARSSGGKKGEAYKEHTDESGTVIRSYPDGKAIPVYTDEQLRAKAKSEAIAWATEIGDAWTTSTPPKAEIDKRANENYSRLVKENEQAHRQARGGVAGEDNNSGMINQGANKGNNVGAIRSGPDSFKGYASPEEGVKAIDGNLKAYAEKHGIDTLGKAISRWSPPSENDTAKLIKDAEAATGFKANERIDLNNPAVRTVLAAAIIRQEGMKGFRDGVGGEPVSSGSNSAPQMSASPPPIDQRKVGDMVTTPKGTFRWTGQGWAAAQ